MADSPKSKELSEKDKTKLAGLTIEQAICLSSGIPDDLIKNCKGVLPVGMHHIDITVNIRGTIKKNVDVEGLIPARAQPWKLLAVCISLLNQNTAKSFAETMSQIIKDSESIDDVTEDMTKTKATECIKTIIASTKGTITGQTKCQLEFKVLHSK